MLLVSRSKMLVIRNAHKFGVWMNVLRRSQHTAVNFSNLGSDDKVGLYTTHDETWLKFDQQVKPVFRYANDFASRTALHDVYGQYTYKALFKSSLQLSKDISRLLGHRTNERVAFLCPNDVTYVMTQWATWMSGQIGLIIPYNSF